MVSYMIVYSLKFWQVSLGGRVMQVLEKVLEEIESTAYPHDVIAWQPLPEPYKAKDKELPAAVKKG